MLDSIAGNFGVKLARHAPAEAGETRGTTPFARSAAIISFVVSSAGSRSTDFSKKNNASSNSLKRMHT